MDNLELLSVGDVTMDVFLVPTESETLCTIDNKECYICFSYGDKIPVKNIDFSIGGNAANNAVGVRRLGIRSGVVSTLGGDTIGNQIIERFQREDVDLTYAIQQPTAGSNYSTVINYGGERTIFSYHSPRSYEFPVHLPVVPWVYLTSMGESFQPFYNHFVKWLGANPSIKLAFNPGSRQLRADPGSIDPVMKSTYVIYVNRAEAQVLTRTKDSHGEEKKLMEELSGLGPKICIVTDGSGGSFVYDSIENRYYHAGVVSVETVEKTGAGDAFGAGCIAGLIKGKSMEEALLWGTVNSASVIGYIGSQKGLLREEDMSMWLERARSSGVEVKEI
jgi:sugar/nucleoside kinase (ribokinase family)